MTEFQPGDYVISTAHSEPSPIWRIKRIWHLTKTAQVTLYDAQGWGVGPIKHRQLSLHNLAPAPPLLVIALAADE